jgi:hypothetical protein
MKLCKVLMNILAGRVGVNMSKKKEPASSRKCKRISMLKDLLFFLLAFCRQETTQAK